MSQDGQNSGVWPTEIKLRSGKRVLAITFDDGKAYDLSAELLRVCSPSAEVQGHGAGQRKTVGGKRNVAITDVEQVGNYAVRLRFDDGHDTGLFSWIYLRELGRNTDQRMRTYLTELKMKGLTRDTPGEI
ncbi:MAG: DUF971 domain-containing protein [Beijerinckiaceae bacterium]|jgi:DUF971 family protein|nr:DUF971 domain-containing protein [Beijerinckiaceae bacterium]